MLQVEAFAKFLERRRENSQEEKKSSSRHNDTDDIKLVMIGGCRNAGDQERVDALHKRVAELKLQVSPAAILTCHPVRPLIIVVVFAQDKVQILTNVPFETLLRYLRESLIGIHTMWCEHFGIG